MKHFGRGIKMNINLEYEIAKGKVNEYIETMNIECEALEENIKQYDNDMCDSTEFDYFDREKALRFVRTWKIINSNAITIAQRNLLCAFAACNNKLEPCLVFFNGKGKNIKNKRTLAVMIANARRAVVNKYNELYSK